MDQARPYWRAMGFADVGAAPAFTSTDVESLSRHFTTALREITAEVLNASESDSAEDELALVDLSSADGE